MSGPTRVGGEKKILTSKYPKTTVNILPFQAEVMEDLLRSYISVYEQQRLPSETTSFAEDYYDDFF